MIHFPIETPAWNDLRPSLAKIVKTTCANAVIAQDNPFIVHMIGIPGSGKSTFVDQLALRMQDKDPVVIGFDRIMKQMPEHAREPNIAKAFAACELPARAAGYLALSELLELKANIIMDHSASDEAHVGLLRYAKNIGYTVIMVHLVAAPEAVKQRLPTRQAREGRYTPPEYVDKRLVIIDGLLAQYRSLSDIFHAYANHDQSDISARQHFFRQSAANIACEIYRSVPVRAHNPGSSAAVHGLNGAAG